jgi:hypothetical protein
MVVSRRPAIAHLAASQASMHDHLFAIAAEGGANRLHQAAAFVLPVAGCTVDMLRIETERTMIPVPAAADRRTDEGLAMTALELFGFGLPAGRCPIGPLWPAVRWAAAP